jgi:hypothetical protein
VLQAVPASPPAHVPDFLLVPALAHVLPALPMRPAAQARPAPRRTALREDQGRPDEGLPAATALRRQQISREPLPITKTITVTEGISVKDLAEKLDVRGKDLIATLLMKGVFVTVNQSLDGELVKDVARQFGADAQVISVEEQLENEAIEGFLEDTTGMVEVVARRSSPSWATSITVRPRCSTRSVRPTLPPAKPAASPSTSAPTR